MELVQKLRIQREILEIVIQNIQLSIPQQEFHSGYEKKSLLYIYLKSVGVLLNQNLLTIASKNTSTVHPITGLYVIAIIMSYDQICYFESSKCTTANTKAELRHNVKLWFAKHTSELKPWFQVTIQNYMPFFIFWSQRQKYPCLHASATSGG